LLLIQTCWQLLFDSQPCPISVLQKANAKYLRRTNCGQEYEQKGNPYYLQLGFFDTFLLVMEKLQNTIDCQNH
jgi:hypothetical protein